MNFDLNDFRLILNIAETSNLTRAAEKSFLSTPAASNRVKNLEKSLGLNILERSSKGVELTEVGLIYLKYAKSIYHEIDCLKGELYLFNKKIKGELSIVANTTAITEYLPIVLSEYLTKFPSISVHLQEMLSRDIVKAVLDRRADLGVISGEVDTKELQTIPLVSSQLILIAPKDHPILEYKNITLLDVVKFSVVTLSEGSAIQIFLNELSQKADKQTNIRVQVSSYDTICQMVAVGVGISIIPLAAFQRLQSIYPDIRYRDINEQWAHRYFKICAIDFKKTSQFANDFIKTLKDNIH